MESARLQREQTKGEPVADQPPARAGLTTASHSPVLLYDARPSLSLDLAFDSSLPLMPYSFQAQLTVNVPGDQYEQEAERVAEQVMRMPGPALRLERKCGCGGTTGAGESCEECASQAPQLQRRATPAGDSSAAAVPSIVHDVLRSPGQLLDRPTRAFMESRFGEDFSHVRVHTDERAAESASAVNALAYTIGSDVVFGARKYAPETAAGRRLIAHELAHVVQPRESAPAEAVVQRNQGPHEELLRQLRQREARLVELRRRITESQDRFTEVTTGAVSREGQQADEVRIRTDAAAQMRVLTGQPIPPSALPTLQRVLRIQYSENAIHFVAPMEITFLGLNEPDGRQRAAVEIPRIISAIRDAWTVSLTQGTYRGVTFSIDPRITYRAPTVSRNANAWQIEVRAHADGGPTATTWWNGLMDLNPAHLQGDRIRAVAHEIYHFFGFTDEYSPPVRQGRARNIVPRSALVGRDDPAGRVDFLGLVDPIVLQNWLRSGAITQEQFRRQTQPSARVWEEDIQLILRALAIQTPAQHRLEQTAAAVRRSRLSADSIRWLEMVEESIRLETEIANLRRQLGGASAR